MNPDPGRPKKIKIIYPHNQKFMLRRAHDVLVMKTCYALAKQGHQVYLLMGKTDHPSNIMRYYGLDPHPNLHLVQLPILRLEGKFSLAWHGVFNYFCQKAVLRIKKEINADLIYMSELKLARFLLKKKQKIRLPFIYEVHGLSAPGYSRPHAVEKCIFSDCDALITTTESLQKVLKKLYSPLPVVFKVSLAADFPDIPEFRLPGASEPWKLCYFGQLYPLQGVELIIKAMRFLPDRVILDVIGGKDRQIKMLRELSGKHNVAHRVNFHGFLPPFQVAAQAAGAHLFVAPSLPEGKMPHVAHTKIYEYLALGRPVVAADLPSIREEIKDGLNGVLFKAGDVKALANGILRLISRPDLTMAMAEYSKNHSQKFSWKQRAESLEGCFHQTLEHFPIEDGK
jgi:glycosyltransferase involved in cell wall biosynthesis